MPIDFSQINLKLDAEPAFIEDVAYVRLNAFRFIEYVNEVEQLACTHVEPLTHGTWNSVYLLQPNQLVLKLSPWSNNYEVDFLNRASVQNLPIPELVAHGRLADPKLADAGYILMDYIPNTANPSVLLKNNALPESAFQSIGKNIALILAKLHAQSFDFIRSSDTVYDHWAPAIQLGELSERGPFNSAWIKKLEVVFKETGYREFEQGHLIHSDANLNNILIDKDDLSFKALIDPGPTTIGMPMFDLAYATWPWLYGLDYMRTVIDNYCAVSSNFDEELFYASLLFIAYQQAEYGNFRAEHMPFLEEHFYSKFVSRNL